MDLGQECSWFPGNRDPWTAKSSRSCLGPLNQMLPSLHFSNSPAPRFLQESWYPGEILGHLRKGSESWPKGLFSPFQSLPQNMMPFSPNKTLLKDQGSPNLLSSSPTIFTRSPVSQHLLLFNWPTLGEQLMWINQETGHLGWCFYLMN